MTEARRLLFLAPLMLAAVADGLRASARPGGALAAAVARSRAHAPTGAFGGARGLNYWHGNSWAARRAAAGPAGTEAAAGAEAGGDGGSTEESAFVVSAEEAGTRLDALLAARFDGASRSYFASLLADGHISVNEKVCKKKSLKPRAGDDVTVRFMWNNELDLSPDATVPVDVLYEDEALIVVNKRAGIVVHPAPGNWNGTLVNGLLHYAAQSGGESAGWEWDGASGASGGERPGIVHRLDKGTTGAIAVAKSRAAHAALSASFAERKVKKEYIALCAGAPGDITVETLIGRHPQHRQRMVALPLDANVGKFARSRFQTLGRDERMSLVQVGIDTGRTHQIRVHLQHLNKPIVGDEVYGFAEWNKKLQKAHGIARPMLHAWRLQFPHPTRPGEEVSVEAPLSEDFYKVARKLIEDADGLQ